MTLNELNAKAKRQGVDPDVEITCWIEGCRRTISDIEKCNTEGTVTVAFDIPEVAL